jgi:purine nucleosidase
MASNQSKRTIIIDTDPGQDDAIAMLFALAAKDRLDVRGITTVAGNATVALTSRNARIVRDWADRTDVNVYAGCPRPLLRELVTAEYAHGSEGMDGVPLHVPRRELTEGHAVDFLIDTLRKAPERDITLCAIAPLTNLAAALIQAPEIRRGIREIVMMGGAFLRRGNITPTAEFNMYVDPHAASVVFGSELPITVLPLDVTHKVLTTQARVGLLKFLLCL